MSDEQKFRTMDWLIGLATTVALALGSWSLITTISHGERIAIIEDTRFTREDARINREEIIKSVTTPRWIEERFNLIQQQNEQIYRQLDSIHNQLEDQ